MNNYKEYLKEIRSYAKLNNIPDMLDDGIDYLTTFIIKKQVHKVLEVGTAIGYSSIMMALASPNVTITSIERDEKRYLEAVKNIKKFNLEERITLIYKDALDVKLDDKYDLIFIDAAKSQNQKFFELFEYNLNSHGTIITDNMHFHGLVSKDDKDIKSRNLRSLVRKIRAYADYLRNNLKYSTTFVDIGDGLAVSTKRN